MLHTSINEHYKPFFCLILKNLCKLSLYHEFVVRGNMSDIPLILRLLLDFSFYVAAPLSLSSACVADAFIFSANEVTRFIFKGKGSMRATEFDWWDFVNPLMKLGWCQWFGAAIFFFGWIHQLRCHAILVSITISRYLPIECKFLD